MRRVPGTWLRWSADGLGGDPHEQREGAVDRQHVDVVEAPEDVSRAACSGSEDLIDHYVGALPENVGLRGLDRDPRQGRIDRG